MPFDLDHALRYLIAAEGSDLHLKVPAYPLVRLHGKLEPIVGTERLTPQDTERVLHEMLNDPNKLAEFEAENEVDFSYALEGLARFRVNAFRQKGFVSLVLRAIPVNIKSIEELSLPPVIRKLAEEERGIILLTGTTGSGKSTTLAAMIDHMNRTMHKHIVTIEDPIEFLHPDRNSIVNQREVGQDTASFKRALRRVLRQDPDVILVGEMRDEETVQTALSAAETGHLVLSTLHTVDASESINRIIDFFEPHQQSQARAMIAGTLKGIVSQRLVRTADGNGRVATAEILVMTGRVHDMIIDPKLTGQLPEVIAEGGYYGMQTFDQHLLQHLEAGRITMEEAVHVATSPHDFKLMVAAAGKPKGEGQAQHPGAAKRRAEPRGRRPASRRVAEPRRRRAPAPPPAPPPAAPAAAAGRRSPAPPCPVRRRRRRRRRPRASSGRRSVRRGLTRPAGPSEGSALAPESSRERTRFARADHAGAVQRDAVPGRVRPPELQAPEGAPRRVGRDPGQGRVDGRLPGRGHFEHAGSGGLGRMMKKAMTGEGTTLMKMSGSGEVFLADHGPGHPPDLPRERLHHGQRAEPARVRRRHRLGHQADPGGASAAMAGGLYNIELRGTGWVAILSDGPPVLLNVASAPTFADAQAAITWSSGVSTSIKTDFKMKNLIGKGSGETIQMAFGGQGWVLVQPSEGQVAAGGRQQRQRRRAGQPARAASADRSDVDDVAVVGGVVHDLVAVRAPPAGLERGAAGGVAQRLAAPPVRAPQSASSRSAPASSRPLSVSS